MTRPPRASARRRHRRLCRLLPVLLTLFALLHGPALAQSATGRASADIARAEVELRAVDGALDGQVDADDRDDLRARAVAAGASAGTAAGRLEAERALVDARIAGLGPAVAGEAPELRRQRAQLASERAAVDAGARRGRLAEVEGRQLAEELDRGRTEQFNRTLSRRVPSPLTPGFWSPVLDAAPRDLRRVRLFLDQGADQVRRQWRGSLPWQAALGAALALLILLPGRRAALGLGRRWLIADAPGHRLRRSAWAVWRVVAGTAPPLLAAGAAVTGLRWAGLLPPRWDALLDAGVAAAGFGGFSGSVTGAVLMRSQPSWRLAALSDETAGRLRPLSLLLALLSAAVIVTDAFNASVGASRAALVAAQAAEALLTLALLASALLALGRIRAARVDGEDAEPSGSHAGLAAVTLLAWLVAGASLVALAWGYVAFSAFLVQLMAWAAVLGCALFLMLRFADDGLTALFNRDGRFGRAAVRGLGVRGSTVDQFGLVLSGTVRIALVIAGLGLLFTPFGAGGGILSLFGRLGVLAAGVELGGVSVSPGAVLRGFAVLVVGLALVRAFMRWLDTRFLPVTDLDGSGRNSVSLVARYVGVALAVIWALASLGIGIERIALLLSALSVGIGFGLQAITQNFVSGLILLAERPIRIGDLVRVGTDEGDVRRISVRSTEIELADHSTLIVPNSELITKSVLNKTRSGPMGRVQIQFSVPLDTDPREVRALVLDVFADQSDMLADPAPAAFVDGIANDRVLFNCFAHVSSPRAAYGARSAALLDLLGRLRDRGIEVGTPPQKLAFVQEP